MVQIVLVVDALSRPYEICSILVKTSGPVVLANSRFLHTMFHDIQNFVALRASFQVSPRPCLLCRLLFAPFLPVALALTVSLLPMLLIFPTMSSNPQNFNGSMLEDLPKCCPPPCPAGSTCKV